jgi:hypothetical protein
MKEFQKKFFLNNDLIPSGCTNKLNALAIRVRKQAHGLAFLSAGFPMCHSQMLGQQQSHMDRATTRAIHDLMPAAGAIGHHTSIFVASNAGQQVGLCHLL